MIEGVMNSKIIKLFKESYTMAWVEGRFTIFVFTAPRAGRLLAELDLDMDRR